VGRWNLGTRKVISYACRQDQYVGILEREHVLPEMDMPLANNVIRRDKPNEVSILKEGIQSEYTIDT
jgi:hypothetical protein